MVKIKINMKRILIGLMILPMITFGQKKQVKNYITVTGGYIAYWDSVTKIPDSVVYTTTPHKKMADRCAGFHATDGRLNEDRDYKKSGYDQGHLCNASDENGTKTDEYNSFDQINIYPQRPNCNRLTWLALENYTRTLVDKYGSVKIKVYWHGVIGYMGVDKVTIPEFCDKEIWYNGIHEKYSLPNSDTVNRHDFTYYRVK
jgi:DNA/RNA endonuclease G (NUC1)